MSDVAPYTGAWIEIYSGRKEDKWQIVAPYTGAWIEIIGDMSNATAKQKVAPYTGAWIEMSVIFAIDLAVMSHPTRVRGLK